MGVALMGIKLRPIVIMFLGLVAIFFVVGVIATLLGIPLTDEEAWNGEKSLDRRFDESKPLLEFLTTWFIRFLFFGGLLPFVAGVVFSIHRIGVNFSGKEPFKLSILIKGIFGTMGWGLMAALFGIMLYGSFKGGPWSDFMDGKWQGRYQCGAIHNVQLDIDQYSSNLYAVFRFETADGKTGRFEMRGKSTPAQTFKLNGYRWLDRPEGMQMLNIEGEVNDARDHLEGNIKTPGCSAIVMDRAN
jgi:hypothetical protein